MPKAKTFLMTCREHFPPKDGEAKKDWMAREVGPLSPSDRLQIAQWFESEGVPILDMDKLVKKAIAAA